MTHTPESTPPGSQSAKPVAWRYHYPGAEELAEVRLYEGMSCEEEAAGMVETPLYAHPPATASQSEALVTQADREVYAQVLTELGIGRWAEDARNGVDDCDAPLALIAQHRAAAEAKGRREGIEEAALNAQYTCCGCDKVFSGAGQGAYICNGCAGAD